MKNGLTLIEINPKVCNGKPVIKGTRIPVTVILDLLEDGQSWKEIIKGYPELREEDIKAAIHYASMNMEYSNFELIGA